MLIEVEHALCFEYDGFIHESFMEVRVEPLTDAQQTLRNFYLAVGPPARVSRYVDWNGNRVHHFGITDYHERIEVLTRSAVETQPAVLTLAELKEVGGAGPDGGGREAGHPGALLDFAAFGGPVARTPELERLARALPVPENAPLGRRILGIGRHLLEHFEYRKGVTDYRSTTRHILEEGGGVCQDFAHLMLGLLRLRAIPCRYVSGYLHLDREGAEPSQSHAWIEVAVPGRGWVAFDPTHDRLADERYVVVARGRHYDDVPPNRGIYRGTARETLTASVKTRTALPRDVASLQEEIGQIDVPVYREQPHPAPPGAAASAAAQQQQ